MSDLCKLRYYVPAFGETLESAHTLPDHWYPDHRNHIISFAECALEFEQSQEPHNWRSGDSVMVVVVEDDVEHEIEVVIDYSISFTGYYQPIQEQREN